MMGKESRQYEGMCPSETVCGSGGHTLNRYTYSQKIVLATGPVFEIEDCHEAVRGKAHTTGELAHRYVVKIQGKETYLYETSGRWFVEMKA